MSGKYVEVWGNGIAPGQSGPATELEPVPKVIAVYNPYKKPIPAKAIAFVVPTPDGTRAETNADWCVVAYGEGD